ncbi:uncharacterized protein YbaA (DUF1428 family) [Amaricoccus macauensis]|uniref:Uncharacterized protein YbaA (DUF1428 family) n=1 Tax=Amaricoccus macauensis TaxID=57001 RepID=A0A840SQW7_9RHOB|nr:DUF1428 domain-containing protein [Amaricoccus macauensis]MBB5221733.1 uncharacterized protein YbaA (DUF1428 family) [Amaricoccus macauensis]
MAYYSGFVAAVPEDNKQKYLEHAKRAWPHFEKRGATRSVETWGEDVQPGKQTDFLRATQAEPGENVVFSWIEWPDRETADRAWQEMMSDKDMEADIGELPFDGKRLFWGGFAPVFAAGTDRGAGYYQGFLVPVPRQSADAYVAMAKEAHDGSFAPNGCLGTFENWGADVPRGKLTDMYRAVAAEDGEDVAFSWTSWPDRETCDAAAEKMMQEMEGQPMPEMPFDGKRMIWGGFTPIFDSDRA